MTTITAVTRQVILKQNERPGYTPLRKRCNWSLFEQRGVWHASPLSHCLLFQTISLHLKRLQLTCPLRPQYVASHNKPGYHEDKEVPADSVTATFAACVLKIKNRRWDGVPFMMRAGKALNQRLAQVQIRLYVWLFSGTSRSSSCSSVRIIHLLLRA